MRYTVIWLPKAEARLAQIWIQAMDQQAVADASDRLDIYLRDDPETKGRPSGKFFIRGESPIAVLYQVDPGDRMVRIIAVKRI